MKNSFLFLFLLGIICWQEKSNQRQASQNPSPMVETIRPHHRVNADDCEGKRIKWDFQDKKARLFIPEEHDSAQDTDLIIHFHGAPTTVEVAICGDPNKVLLTITGGSGSSSYGRLFKEKDDFQNLLDQVQDSLGKPYNSLTLTGWSAGYGAIRAILKDHESQVDQVVLLDGLHASYLPEGKVLFEGGKIDSTQLETFLKYSRKASKGDKGFLITHSSIFPGTYASTTECTEYLIETMKFDRSPVLKEGPVGMQQVGEVQKGGFLVLSYAGNTAPDHIDHLHGLGYFLERVFSIGEYLPAGRQGH